MESLECIIELHRDLPETHFVSVGDREADVYDLFLKERPEGVDLLVRAIRDRRIEEDPQRYLWAALASSSLAAEVAVWAPATPKRPAHLAQLEVRWKPITLRPPKHRTSEKLDAVTIWAVWANDAENLIRLLAVFSVVAWRILYAGTLARAIPDAPCSLLLEDAEWQALYCALHHTNILPERLPTLREAVRMIGRLGGFQGRKSDGEPGAQALWTGFRRLHDLTAMYKIMRPPDPYAK